MKEPDPNPSVGINIMAAIGELAQVAREDMKYCVDDLCPIIMDMLQDSSSLAKREVALWTFGQLVEKKCRVGLDICLSVCLLKWFSYYSVTMCKSSCLPVYM